jgi:hypothetical protein
MEHLNPEMEAQWIAQWIAQQSGLPVRSSSHLRWRHVSGEQSAPIDIVDENR